MFQTSRPQVDMKKKKISLRLIPTPIDERSPLGPDAFSVMMSALEQAPEKSVFAIEDLKPGRRRWLKYGLPREQVEDFVLFNEQTQEQLVPELIEKMKKGFQVFLMSDGGLPAFCDPGQQLVQAAHQAGLRVSMTSFANSVMAALVLSGFESSKFMFQGFLPKKGEERTQAIDELARCPYVQILMETPYRLTRLLEELSEHPELKSRQLCLALDLSSDEEELIFGRAVELLERVRGQKREFVLVFNSI